MPNCASRDNAEWIMFLACLVFAVADTQACRAASLSMKTSNRQSFNLSGHQVKATSRGMISASKFNCFAVLALLHLSTASPSKNSSMVFFSVMDTIFGGPWRPFASAMTMPPADPHLQPHQSARAQRAVPKGSWPSSQSDQKSASQQKACGTKWPL